MSISARLILLRKTLDINQSDMAMVMGCSQSNISYYENDGNTISVKCLIALRNAYNVNLNWLLLGMGEMFLPVSGIQQPTESPTLMRYISPKKKDKLAKKIMELSDELQNILQELKENPDE